MNWEKEIQEKLVELDQYEKNLVKMLFRELIQKTREETIQDIRGDFVKEFCNDHNADSNGNGIRWLRGVALDTEDLLEMILKFFAGKNNPKR